MKTNKPVAWMQSKTTELLDGCECMQSVSFFKANDDDIPLYTHPVKEQDTDCQYCKQGCIRCDARKQLTDEEIDEVYCSLDYGHSLNELARALLRKAQEK